MLKADTQLRRTVSWHKKNSMPKFVAAKNLPKEVNQL